MHPTISRHKNVILALTGVSAAVAIYLIHSHYLDYSASLDSNLQRRNAIRRRNLNGGRSRRIRNTQTYRAVASLKARIEENNPYGTLTLTNPSTESAAGIAESPQVQLLPPSLPTVADLERHFGNTLSQAQDARQSTEAVFMHSFLLQEFPGSATILEEERAFLKRELMRMGISEVVIEGAVQSFNENPHFGQNIETTQALDNANDAIQSAERLLASLNPDDDVTDQASDVSFRQGLGGSGDAARGNGHNMLDLMYHIAEDKARRDSYVHRGIECNSCGVCPIQGIRYRCANCQDFDLCEDCEAQQVHFKTHIFYKVRIPAPTLGNPRQAIPVWYPGKPSLMQRSLGPTLSKRILKEVKLTPEEVEALWEQYRCLAGQPWPEDPNGIGIAIDRKIFDKCFVPPSALRPPPPNLIYDRMFHYYDSDRNGMIGFEEFIKGLAGLQDKTRDAKLRRIFNGYDLDEDGFVDRRDFLRIFRAYYALCKEINKEVVAAMEEDVIDRDTRDIVHGSQPISTAFPGSIPLGQPSQSGVGKTLGANGNMEVIDSEEPVLDSGGDHRSRNDAIGDAAVSRELSLYHDKTWIQDPDVGQALLVPADEAEQFEQMAHREHNSRPDNETDHFQVESRPWPPPGVVLDQDIVANAMGGVISQEEILDPIDRARVLQAQLDHMNDQNQETQARIRRKAVNKRWTARQFYTDVEEGQSKPPQYTEADSSDEEDGIENMIDTPTDPSDSRPPSRRSRSSSKVRFEDDVTDTDYETRSNTSTRSIPIGERWGGFELPEAEKDVGREILFQAAREGFNELLDPLFKEREELYLRAIKTKSQRTRWAAEIDDYIKSKTEQERVEEFKSNDPTSAMEALAKENAMEPLQIHSAGMKISQSPMSSITNVSGFDVEDFHLDTSKPPPFSDLEVSSKIAQDDDVDNEDGGTDLEAPPLKQGTEAISKSGDHDDVSSVQRDPTMPQFMPDNESSASPNILSNLARAERRPIRSLLLSIDEKGALAATRTTASPSQPLLPPPRSPTPPPSTTVMAIYAQHQVIVQEATERNGGGKLNFDEFKAKMIDDETADREARAKMSSKEKGKARAEPGSGSLGRLGFLGTWIEMTSF